LQVETSINNLKIKAMKKSVYLTGITCTILMLLGCMFKIMHWPGASIMLILSVFLFCFYFLPVALVSSYKSQEDGKYKNMHIITYIVFSICVMGVLFKVMHWPGASIFLMVGLPLPFVLFLPAYLYYTKDDKKATTTNFLGIMFGLIFLAVFSVLLALSISKQVLNSAIIKVYSNQQAKDFSESVISNLNDQNNIKKASDELCAYIDDLKCELLSATDNDLCNGSKMASDVSLWQMSGLDNKANPTFVLYGAGNKNKIAELRTKVKAYHETLIATKKMNKDLEGLVNDLFDVNGFRETIEINGERLNWEQKQFSNKQLIFVLDGLSEIQSNVRLVECEYLLSVK